MTQYLTKLWKERKRKEGLYYIHVHIEDSSFNKRPIVDEEIPKYYDGEDFDEYDRSEVKEVLARVPSYSEYSELKRKSRFSK